MTSQTLWSRYDRHFVGITRHLCVELKGEEDLSCYSNKTEPASLRKCPYDHRLANEAYLSAITVTSISQSFYLQDGGKNQLAQIWNKNTSLSPYNESKTVDGSRHREKSINSHRFRRYVARCRVLTLTVDIDAIWRIRLKEPKVRDAALCQITLTTR